jgi:hypothetical protein
MKEYQLEGLLNRKIVELEKNKWLGKTGLDEEILEKSFGRGKWFPSVLESIVTQNGENELANQLSNLFLKANDGDLQKFLRNCNHPNEGIYAAITVMCPDAKIPPFPKDTDEQNIALFTCINAMEGEAFVALMDLFNRCDEKGIQVLDDEILGNQKTFELLGYSEQQFVQFQPTSGKKMAPNSDLDNMDNITKGFLSEEDLSKFITDSTSDNKPRRPPGVGCW